MAVGYLGPEGAAFDEFPYHQSVLHKATPEYREFPGWHENITGARTYEDLPQQARDYLDFVSDYLGIPIALIGVGPARDQIIWTDASRAVELPAATA